MPQNNQSGRQTMGSAISRIGETVAEQIGADAAINAAFKESGESSLPGVVGGPQDAYRHILISAELVRQFGSDIGPKLASAHELENKLGGQSEADSKMDAHNNALAIEIGKKAKTWQDVVRMAREKITEAARHGGDGKEGRAVWNNRSMEPFTLDLDKPAAPNAKGGVEHRHPSLPSIKKPEGKPEEEETGSGETPNEATSGREGRPQPDAPAKPGDRSDAGGEGGDRP